MRGWRCRPPCCCALAMSRRPLVILYYSKIVASPGSLEGVGSVVDRDEALVDENAQMTD